MEETSENWASILLGIVGMMSPQLFLNDDLKYIFYSRSQLTVIPQDPMLFHDTIRNNIDPTSCHQDSTIWYVLELVQMKSNIKKLEQGLEHVVEEGE